MRSCIVNLQRAISASKTCMQVEINVCLECLHMLNTCGKRFKVSYNNTVHHLKEKLPIATTSCPFKILQIFHFLGLSRYESINNLDTKIWSFKLKRQIALCLPGLKQ